MLLIVADLGEPKDEGRQKSKGEFDSLIHKTRGQAWNKAAIAPVRAHALVPEDEAVVDTSQILEPITIEASMLCKVAHASQHPYLSREQELSMYLTSV